MTVKLLVQGQGLLVSHLNFKFELLAKVTQKVLSQADLSKML